jgi:hypothetical protein
MESKKQKFVCNVVRRKYEGESKIIRNVDTYCAVGYTAGRA